MKRSYICAGLLAILLAATLSAFTTKSARYTSNYLWFDPNFIYMFQFFGTNLEALDHFSGSSAGDDVISLGYLFSRNALPPIGNPFDTIVYSGGSGEPTYGSELKLDGSGVPIFIPDEVIFE